MIAPIRTQDASSRITEVLDAITGSSEWDHQARAISSNDWMRCREKLRHFFDDYEGIEGEDWLGVMEWAVIEEVRLRGSALKADQLCVDSILSRMATHPNIKFLDNKMGS